MTTHVLPASPVDHPETRPRTPLGVEVVGLMRSFGPKAVLRGVDLSVTRGGVLALLGANGAGKTTLLRVLATLNKPDGGTARVAGYDVVRDAALLRRVVGYVGHQPHLYEELTARENLLFFARMYGLVQPAARADALLERFDLRARASDRARTLSRGQLQRLALARGIVQNPAVLLLDEPETGLDESAFALLRALVAERQEFGLTTLFTTHQLDRALHLADEIAVLARGRIAFSASAADVSADDVRAAVRDLTEVRR
jgi:heme ABC exporter ATP-binding subunit CcmA